MISHTEHYIQITKAICAIQAEGLTVPKDQRNDHYNSEYSSLLAIRRAVQAPLAKHGVAVMQAASLEIIDGQSCVVLTTRLSHVSGEYLESRSVSPPMRKGDVHEQGSLTTYLSRYSLQSLTGCLLDGEDPTDDDGNIAMEGRLPKKPAASSPPPKRKLKAPFKAGAPAEVVSVQERQVTLRQAGRTHEMLIAPSVTAKNLDAMVAVFTGAKAVDVPVTCSLNAEGRIVTAGGPGIPPPPPEDAPPPPPEDAPPPPLSVDDIPF